MKSTDYFKQRRSRVWISCLTILLGLPLLLYFGYCWDLWGRRSLLIQYLFQCSCPPASEEARYPRPVDVIIPACQNVDVFSRLSPSGRFLYIREEDQGLTSAYFLDLQTVERIEVTDQPFSSFLTDDLWFVENGLNDFIIDRTSGKQYPILTFRYWRENAYVDGKPNLELLISALHQAEKVFLTPNYNTVVVLMSNNLANSEQSFTFDNSDFPEWGPLRIEQFLQENNIVYQTVLEEFPDEVLSPDGRFVARADGIYLTETDQKIVSGISWARVRGWTYDGSAVVYTSYPEGRCLLRFGFLLADDTACLLWVPQPVLMLDVPKEFLLSGSS